MRAKILLADDDELIVDVLQRQLEYEGFEVIPAFDGATALALARRHQPDLLLLDVMMPRRTGFEVCQEFRRESHAPILMVTARGEEIDHVLGLELGADDYIVKPFKFRELVARIRANLRRVAMTGAPAGQAEDLLEIGSLRIDRRRHLVTRNGSQVNLSQREYDLLLALVAACGAVIKRGDLLNRVWGEEWVGDPRTLDVHIRWLREKIEDDPARPRKLLTVRGVGYRLVTPDEL